MFYARFSPRGFSNEFSVYAFACRADRDTFVASVPRTQWSAGYGALVYTDNESARARRLTAQEARRLLSGALYGGAFFNSEKTPTGQPHGLTQYFAGWVLPKGSVDASGHIALLEPGYFAGRAPESFAEMIGAE